MKGAVAVGEEAVALASDGQPRILVVDDEAGVRRVLTRTLERQGYACAAADSGERAIELMLENEFDLVLTDMDMSGMSGLDLILEVSQAHPDTATVMVTALDDPKLARAAVEMGAYGYIVKPFEANEILINVVNGLRRRALEIENRAHRQRLEQMVRDRTQELWHAIRSLEDTQSRLRSSQEETIKRLSIAAEYRDDETGRHIQRMSRYCGILGELSGMDVQEVELLRSASQMHDVGKIGIPDHILLKPGRFNAEERAVMERHAEIGYKILAGSDSELLNLAALIAFTHHEKVDGSGYPRRLKGDQIPIEGRIAAVADVFDALTTPRVYKKPYPIGKAVEIMQEGSGTHFDAELLDMFLSALDRVLVVKAELDEVSPLAG